MSATAIIDFETQERTKLDPGREARASFFSIPDDGGLPILTNSDQDPADI